MAFAFGAAVAGSGAIAAWAVAATVRERTFERLGVKRVPERVAFAGLGRRISASSSASGWPWGWMSLLAALCGSSLVGGLLGARVAGPVGGAVALVACPWLVRRVGSRRLVRSREEAEVEFREVVSAIGAGVRAGLSLRRALEEAARDAGPGVRGPLDASLRKLEVGEPLGAALDELARGIGSSEARLLATLLDLHQRVGGELPALLDELSSTVARRVEARRHVRALTAQGRASGVVLAVLPVVFIGLLTATSGDGLGAFYRTPEGAILLGAGLGLDGLGFLWVRRILRPT